MSHIAPHRYTTSTRIFKVQTKDQRRDHNLKTVLITHFSHGSDGHISTCMLGCSSVGEMKHEAVVIPKLPSHMGWPQNYIPNVRHADLIQDLKLMVGIGARNITFSYSFVHGTLEFQFKTSVTFHSLFHIWHGYMLHVKKTSGRAPKYRSQKLIDSNLLKFNLSYIQYHCCYLKSL